LPKINFKVDFIKEIFDIDFKSAPEHAPNGRSMHPNELMPELRLLIEVSDRR
jgi:hypothetical protein